LLTSLITLWREEPILRRHATSVALCFAAFNAFWSLVALRLAASPFGLSTNGIALFAFVGISGAISAPLAGQLGDRGKSRIARSAAHIGIALAVLLAWLGGSTHLLTTPTARLAVLVIAALLLDAGTIADLTLGRRAVNLLRTEARGRINGLFTGVIFVGGAIGSAVAGIAWAHAGWSGVCFIALMLALIATWYGMRRESSIFAAVTE
jgi:predicted MFS family arabinose efflux permease